MRKTPRLITIVCREKLSAYLQKHFNPLGALCDLETKESRSLYSALYDFHYFFVQSDASNEQRSLYHVCYEYMIMYVL